MRTLPTLLTAVCLSLPLAVAAAPPVVGYQGLLTDSSGSPLNGSVSFEFRLFAAPSGGSALWTELQPSVFVLDGVYSVELGSVTPFPATAFPEADRWLEVVAAGEVMAPRHRLASVPYALNAQRIGSLDSLAGTLCNAANPLAGNVVVSYAINGSVTLSCSGMFTLTVARQSNLGQTGLNFPNVTSTPAGISCGADCSEPWLAGTVVTLAGGFNGSWVLQSWSGGGCSGTGSCQVTLDGNKTVTAIYVSNL